MWCPCLMWKWKVIDTTLESRLNRMCSSRRRLLSCWAYSGKAVNSKHKSLSPLLAPYAIQRCPFTLIFLPARSRRRRGTVARGHPAAAATPDARNWSWTWRLRAFLGLGSETLASTFIICTRRWLAAFSSRETRVFSKLSRNQVAVRPSLWILKV